MSVEGSNGTFSRGAVTDCDQTGRRGEPETVKLDPAIDPNHGRRHTWKTRTLGAGIEERLWDAITGHRVASVGRRYETPTLLMLADARDRCREGKGGRHLQGPETNHRRWTDQGSCRTGDGSNSHRQGTESRAGVRLPTIERCVGKISRSIGAIGDDDYIGVGPNQCRHSRFER